MAADFADFLPYGFDGVAASIIQTLHRHLGGFFLVAVVVQRRGGGARL